MINNNIIETLKSDIKELKDLKHKHNFSKVFFCGKYSILLNAFISEGSSCFNKTYREVQFKTQNGANAFITLLNIELKTNLKGFAI